MIPARDALKLLRDGNARFVADVRDASNSTGISRRRELAAGQEPFAIILGCSDSRVPAEIVFDQGLGDLFVIRVAGNIVAPSQIEGAILATLEELVLPKEQRSKSLRSIVDRVRPSVESLLGERHSTEDLVHHAVRANIRVSVNQLRHGSEVLEQMIKNHELMVVGAEYSLETGVVDFFDGAADGLD
jgi:carbonic anhydrase